MRTKRMLALAVLVLGCASGPDRPEEIAEPTIYIQQGGPIFFGSTNSAPVTFDVFVTNNANVAVEVREIELNSLGSAQFGVLTTRRIFRRRIAPRGTESFPMFTTAIRQTSQTSPTGPSSLRAIVIFETLDGDSFREIVHQHFVTQ